MITTVDIETTYDNNFNPSPFVPENKLISVGINDKYYFFYHTEFNGDTSKNFKEVQDLLDNTTLLVGHNIKFDLMWMLEAGFKYSGAVYDTMITEYVLLRGTKQSLKLSECCKRRHLGKKLGDTIDKYIEGGKDYSYIPIDILEEYGRKDVEITRELYDSQQHNLREATHLQKSITMMNQFLLVLIEMERNGIYIETDLLDKVEKEFTAEYHQVHNKIKTIIQRVMGDTPINLSSPEQLSWMVYSKKVVDKKVWTETFNIGIDKNTGRQKKRTRHSDRDFQGIVNKWTEPVYKTSAMQCETCQGVGYIQKFKVDGNPYKNMSKCSPCNGEGVKYIEREQIAGFQIPTKFANDVSDGGFKTDKETLKKIASYNSGLIREFVELVTRYGALEVWLSTFVRGIKDALLGNFLHPAFMQCITATGRLSSRNPNFQNQPRAKTFPIRQVIRSRFEGGKIMEIDYAQLEFRAAVFLAQDRQGIEDIVNGVDVHQYTANIIGCSRQEAKPHTFKPLYGGKSGTENERKYYKAFLNKYKDISKWHTELENKAIKTKMVTLPTGRQYCFPYIRRMSWGASNYPTQVKNYPVQGFATADVVPLACINIHKLMKEHGCKSLLINTVHDSIVVDVYPTEVEVLSKILKQGCLDVKQELKSRYDIDFNVPLDVDVKMGIDWLNLEEID
jgi:DNA polymerase I-like protein with 3'-5' exonuclease and polymerase domains